MGLRSDEIYRKGVDLNRGKTMKPSTWLRIAAGLQAFMAFGHTVGGTPRVAIRGPGEDAVFRAMQSFHFTIAGVERTHWNFYQGFALMLGAEFAILAVLTWQMSSLSRRDADTARSLTVTLLVNEILIAAFSWIYFFAAPAITSTLITLCLGVAIFAMRAEPAMATSRAARA